MESGFTGSERCRSNARFSDNWLRTVRVNQCAEIFEVFAAMLAELSGFSASACTLGVRGEQVHGFHVAGIGGSTISDLGCDLEAPAGQFGQRRLVQIRQGLLPGGTGRMPPRRGKRIRS
jgi:hypothetical protein